MRDLVLASTSRHRRALIDRLGIAYEAVAPRSDEAGLDDLPAEDRTIALAVRKARSVASLHPGAILIGSDQVAEIDGTALHKPETRERAIETLRRLSGREHRLVTAVAVVASERVETGVDVARLRMRRLTDGEIARYVDRADALDCAGAYRIEGPGAALFASIETSDPTGIVGLPITILVELLSRFGVSVLE